MHWATVWQGMQLIAHLFKGCRSKRIYTRVFIGTLYCSNLMQYIALEEKSSMGIITFQMLHSWSLQWQKHLKQLESQLNLHLKSLDITTELWHHSVHSDRPTQSYHPKSLWLVQNNNTLGESLTHDCTTNQWRTIILGSFWHLHILSHSGTHTRNQLNHSQCYNYRTKITE